MKKPSNVHFVDENVRKAFEKLLQGTTEEKELYISLCNAFEAIQENAFSGIQIPKKLIPKEYIQKYNIHNLWKYNLPMHGVCCMQSKQVM